MMRSPALHPILEALFEENLPLQNADARLSPKEAAFHTALCQFRHPLPTSEETARANGERLVHLAEATEDAQLILGAYIEWFQVYVPFANAPDLEHLVNAIADLPLHGLPIIFEAWVLQVKMVWAQRRRRQALYLYLLKRCIASAPVGSRIWAEAIRHYADRMGTLGRLGALASLLDAYRNVFGEAMPGLERPVFFDACHNGNVAKALGLLPQVRAMHAAGESLGSYATYRVFLELLTRHVPVGCPPPPITYEEDCDFCRREAGMDPEGFLMTTRHLLAGDPEAALASARTYAAALGERVFYLSRFDGDDMIRAELAAGNPDSALLLLRKRFRCGIYVWMNDLYGARIALLRGKSAMGEAMFLSALRAVRHHGAENRLRFELCLACEIPSATLVRWVEWIRDPDPPTLPRFPVPALVVPSLASAPSSPYITARHMGADTEAAFVGSGDVANQIRAKIEAFASIDPPVLLTGETGVGKELVAQRIHESGTRRKRPFIAVNCAALSSSLLLSELFGHVRGAFTGATRHRAGLFETAGDGSLLLDEIGDLAPEVQGALLRVLETGEFRPVGSDVVHTSRCRILAATHRDLAALVEENRFRRDLYYRLSRLQICIPPLRERREDVIPLALYFLRRYHPRPAACGFSEGLREALLAYPWSGNVRELKSAMEMLCLLYGNCDVYTCEEMGAAIPQWAAVRGSGGERAALPPPSPAEEQTHRATPDGAPRTFAQTNPTRMAPWHVHDKNTHARWNPDRMQEEERPEHPLDRLDYLEAFVRHHKRVTSKQVIHLFRVSHPTATRMLRTLIGKGVLRKVEPNRSPRTHYFEHREDDHRHD